MLIVIAAALVVLYLSGPRVVLDTTVHPQTTDLPDDLDQHLRAAESRYSDITPGAEKTVVWADPQRRQRTPVAFVYLHGFSATRQESVPVPGDIAAHFNSNIYYARLAGNGRSDDALAQGSVNKWVNDVAEALAVAERLGEKTVIIGCSTGASLAWWAAHQPLLSERVSAMVFLSPNFGVADPRASVLLMPWGAWLARLVVGQYRESEPISEAHAAYWTNRYPISALLPMMGMVKLAMRYPAQHCKVPVHVTYSTNDDTVSVEKIKEFCALLPANCETLEITQPAGASQHVIVGDILAPENNRTVTAAVISFLTTALTEHS